MKTLRRSAIMAILFLVLASFAVTAVELPATQLGEGLTIWFDTGGPVGGTYNTIVQNGALQAARDLGCKVELIYSDWSPQTMIENFKKALSVKPDGIVVMGHPGDDAYEPFIKEAIEKGIIVTSSDTELPGLQGLYQSRGFGYTGVDNYERGKSLATETLNRAQLEKGDKALVWGLKPADPRPKHPRYH